MEERDIPVLLAPKRLDRDSGFVGRAPVIEVHVAHDPNWRPGQEAPLHNGRRYLAMLDTGADSTAIDADLVQALGAQPIGSGNVHGWGGRATNVGIVYVQILVPQPANLAFGAQAGVREFRKHGETWDLILGRSFLQHCRFLADGPGGRYALTWIDQ